MPTTPELEIEIIRSRLALVETRLDQLERRHVDELRLYNIAEVVDLTGLSRSTVLRLIEAGRLPVVRLEDDSRPRVRHLDLVQMLSERTGARPVADATP